MSQTKNLPHLLTIGQTIKEYETDGMGLTGKEAQKRLEENGPNILPEGKKKGFFHILLDQLKNVMLIVLIIAAGISFALGETTDGIIILLVVALNVLLGAAQESRASGRS